MEFHNPLQSRDFYNQNAQRIEEKRQWRSLINGKGWSNSRQWNSSRSSNSKGWRNSGSRIFIAASKEGIEMKNIIKFAAIAVFVLPVLVSCRNLSGASDIRHQADSISGRMAAFR